jgi:predicted transcriptional regulator
MTSFSIDLADSTATALRQIAETTAETPDDLIRRAVEELVADYTDGRIAMQRLADPTDPMMSSEELRRRLEED